MVMIRSILVLALCSCAFGMLLGGVKKLNPEEIESELFSKIRATAVHHSNKFLSKQCESSNECKSIPYYAFFHMENITKQVVNGFRYEVDFTVMPTKCSINASEALLALGECGASADVAPQQCHGTFIERGHDFKVLQMRCIPKVTVFLHRSVRSVSGDETAAKVGSFGQFVQFKQRYNRRYSGIEQLKRFRVFRENMQKAHVLNQLELGTAKYGASPFADMTESEFRNHRLSPVWDQSQMPKTLAKPATVAAPDSFDWRQHNAVTEVKNQGQCGSCWAFSTTGNIEGQWAIQKGSLISLSEQELVDCDKVDQGCGGGLPSNAYKEIMRLGGLESESDYPYTAENGECHFNKTKVKVYINGSVALPKDEGQLASWLAQNGPISIGINAFAMQFYMGGISHPWKFLCNPNNLDHGVLIVGYGVQNSTPYWIVKNSWGASWGEQGYYLVYRGSGVCGLNQMATSSVVH